MKSYKRRDSATSVLRKMGIDKSQYDNFIHKVGDEYRLNMEAAKASLIPKPKKRSKITIYKNNQVRSMSKFIRKCILDGKTNQEVFLMAQTEFGEEVMNEKRKHYPSWYRSEMRRKGMLPEAFDFQSGELPPRFE